MMRKNEVSNDKLLPNQKYCLTVQEASKYFEIGENKIRALAKDHMEDGIFVLHGVKLLILRPQFEIFLTQTSEI